MPATLRTFVAVDIDPAIATQAGKLIERLSKTEANVKWVDPKHLHFTLKFLGEINIRETPEVCAVVEDAVKSLAGFRAQVGSVGAFPDPSRPRTVWLGITDGADEFVQLHDTIENGLHAMGFRREHRRYRPHLTLGRVRQSPFGIEELAELIHEHQDFTAGELYVSDVKVFSSRLEKSGPAYTLLGTADLRG